MWNLVISSSSPRLRDKSLPYDRYRYFVSRTKNIWGLSFSNNKSMVKSSVADPGCLSWIPETDCLPSKISHPGTNKNKEQEREKFFVLPFLIAIPFTKQNSELFYFDQVQKKIWSNWQELKHFKPKIFLLSIIVGLRSEFFPSQIQGQKSTGSPRIRNTEWNPPVEYAPAPDAGAGHTRSPWRGWDPQREPPSPRPGSPPWSRQDTSVVEPEPEPEP